MLKLYSQFLFDASIVHGDKYNYNNCEQYYKNTHSKLPIKCYKHDIFWQSYKDHITHRHGCKQCYLEESKIKALNSVPVIDGKRWCKGCDRLLDICEFYKSNRRLDGYSTKCKKCQFTLEQRKNKSICRIERYHKDPEKAKALHQKWYFNNLNYRMNWNTNYFRKARLNNPNLKMYGKLRSRIYDAIKSHRKSNSTMNLVGCDMNLLNAWLNITALANNIIDFDIRNYSSDDYHIDHKTPCSAFNLICGYHQKLCFHFSNLQILRKKDNIRKLNKIINV
jgi:hypothetical protein